MITDLDKLIEAVEANSLKYYIKCAINAGLHRREAWSIDAAFHGSLDEAKALHEVLLPGWDWCVTPSGASVYSPQVNIPIDIALDKPSRAWLIAILKAYRSQVQK